MAIVDTYRYIGFPYISKSSYKKWKACKYQFKRLVIDGLETSGNYIMARGTSLHYLFYKFFDLVDFEYLYELDWSTHNGTVFSQVYVYFYKIIIHFLGKSDADKINNKFFDINIRSFCMFEERHWVELRSTLHKKSEIRRHFMSGVKERERFMVNHDNMIFGTADRIMHEGNKIIILDYKTGKVPLRLKEEERDGVYTSLLPTRYTMEGNFYVLLHILELGYTVHKDNKGTWQIYKDGKECNKILKSFDYAFLFTGDFQRGRPVFYVGRKKSSLLSIRTILKTLEKIRRWEDWKREPTLIRCGYCPLYRLECKGKIPIEIYGDVFERESAAQKSIYESERHSTGSDQMAKDG